jgi:hypothetical protein
MGTPKRRRHRTGLPQALFIRVFAQGAKFDTRFSQDQSEALNQPIGYQSGFLSGVCLGKIAILGGFNIHGELSNLLILKRI